MHSISFELSYAGATEELVYKASTHAWSGSVPGFGSIELKFPMQRVDRDANLLLGAAWGENFPAVTYISIGFRNYLRMADMQLNVNEWPALFKRRRLALTRRGRALHINVWGRDYRYQVLAGKRQHVLLRDGASITTTRSEWRHPRKISGVAQGNIDNVDVALAIALQSMYTRNLTFGGALYSLPGRMLSRADLPDF
ncbi:hypothetical protein J7F03_02720 [Streptomyces sp. ISL-43]|uniref:hypothetical protein n=1 Tax=Streptomyces sp. ISL-43 TaxID=2819183 RepID=UPI001BE53D5A|nr:hypothetical protein [Streptomyces sp. ISL-43]MBT2446017.1 hypothetical protein [Streptomyces sp. ISL-43]